MTEREPPTPACAQAADQIGAYCASFPETTLDHPWGERAYKVRGKVFVFLYAFGDSWGLSVKLPQSAADALQLPFATPTGYGLGRAGWVSARFRDGDEAPFVTLQGWVEESYQAAAPKRVIAAWKAGR
jgi:predicted DNA-binding protein (MmcQ/YjbR family)